MSATVNKQRLLDYAIVLGFCAALALAVLVTLPIGPFGKPTSIAQTIPWSVWRF
jgi:hypothetical protein